MSGAPTTGPDAGATPAARPRPDLRGTWGTVLLPVRPDESIDFESLAVELDALFGAGLAGVYTCGTAGEFHTLDEDEFDTLSELVSTKARQAGSAFQIGASHMSAQTCLSRLRRPGPWPRRPSRWCYRTGCPSAGGRSGPP